MELDALQQSALWELQEADQRERLPQEKIPENVRPYNLTFWLGKCVTEYHLGSHPYVQQLYKERFGRDIPQE
ncbi:MAG: hypothetical protein AABW61_01265 [Candidatus Aenigmatarchaeota archaeon]